MLEQITPLILTYNEAPNIERTLGALGWAREVLVVDSYSTDNTMTLCATFENVRVVQHAFENFAAQCNFGLTQITNTDWVLSLDADYIVTPELVEELAQLKPDTDRRGYQIGFRYLIDGLPLRGSLYPARTALYLKQSANYRQDGHAHRVVVDGEVAALTAKILHDDRKPYSRWLVSQKNYAQQEAEKIKATRWSDLGTADKLRACGLGPVLILPYTLFFKGLILDGKAGIKYCYQRFIAELELLKALFTKWQTD